MGGVVKGPRMRPASCSLASSWSMTSGCWNAEDRLRACVWCQGPVCRMHTPILIAVSSLETQALLGCPASSRSN